MGSKARIIAAVAATGLATAGLALPATAEAAQPATRSATAAVAAPAGQLPRPPSTRSMRKAGPTQQLTFYWGLKRNDTGAAAAANRVSNPSSRTYRKFPSASTVARRYGASASTVKAVKAYLKGKKLTGVLDTSRLFMRVNGSVKQFERAFHQSIGTTVNDGFRLWQPYNDPNLPARISKLAPEPIWMSQRQVGGSKSARSGVPKAPRSSPEPTNHGNVIGCSAVRHSSNAPYSMTVGQGARAYGMDSLRIRKRASSRGDVWSRPPIGVLSQGSGYSNTKLGQARECLGFNASAYRVETDGVRQLPSGGEGNLDVQMVLGALKSDYRVPVFESSGFRTAFLAPVAALNSYAPPRVLTLSYGQCEQYLWQHEHRMSNAIYLRLALIGTSVLASSGDYGSSGCVSNNSGEDWTGQAVSFPASSPWVTAVGGTRIVLNKANHRVAEYTWNDSPWGTKLASGGGTSTLSRRPSWQPFSTTHTNWRSVPDLSAHASGEPGWYVFGEGIVEGTSASTPLVASGVALLNLKLAQSGQKPMGLLNPWLYQLPRKAIFDVVSGNTDLFNNGCCTARKGYDQATGIGTPNFSTWPKLIRKVR